MQPPGPGRAFKGIRCCETVLQCGFNWRYLCAMLTSFVQLLQKPADYKVLYALEELTTLSVHVEALQISQPTA